MKHAPTHSGLTLAMLLLTGCGCAVAQPYEPSDFSTGFVGFDYLVPKHPGSEPTLSSDGKGFRNFGLWYRGITGAVTGELFEDFSNKRVRYTIASANALSLTPIVSIWKFYDNQLMVTYTYATNSCVKSTLTSTLSPLFEWALSAQEVGPVGYNETVWALIHQASSGAVWQSTVSPHETLELSIGNDIHEQPIYMAWYTPGRMTRIQFLVFTSGQPDASQFSLPAACAF
jgi:hypothetical protein